MTAETADAPAFLFVPRDAYRMRFRGGMRSPADPEYPAPSVMIDYYFVEKPSSEAILEIMDASGKVIRVFSSDSKTSRLNANAGMHRLHWDMRHFYESPDTRPSGRPSRRRGPLMVPGAYQARLAVGDWSRTVQFDIRMDPRVAADGVTRADLVAQEKLCLQVLELLGDARSAQARVDARKKELDARLEEGSRLTRQERSTLEKLTAVRAKLVTAEGRYPQPMLIAQISYLLGMLDLADQKLGRDAYLRYDELRLTLQECREEIDQALKNR